MRENFSIYYLRSGVSNASSPVFHAATRTSLKASAIPMAAITRLVRRTSSISYLASKCLSMAVASETSSHAPPYNAPPFHPKPLLPRKDPKDRNVQWIFLGCPGVGKGTYASRLCDLLGVPHIATGDLVREELASSGPLSAQVSSSISFFFCFAAKFHLLWCWL